MSELRALARGTPAPEWRRIVDVPNPAANANVTIPAEAKRAWRLLAVSTTLVAAAVVANRDVVLAHIDASNVALASVPITASITTGQTRRITWAAGIGATVVGSGAALVLPLPEPWYVMPGESLVISGANNAADQFSATRLVVVECYTGDAVANLNREQMIVDRWTALHDLITYGAP